MSSKTLLSRLLEYSFNRFLKVVPACLSPVSSQMFTKSALNMLYNKKKSNFSYKHLFIVKNSILPIFKNSKQNLLKL